jgi:uncharacterized membrane protein
MEVLQGLALVAATITTGLVAGLLFAYAVSVMPALRLVDDRTFVEVMQRINVAIINGWFLTCFVGALVFTALAGLLHLGADSRSALPWIVVAFVLYVAALVITGRLNVPLNNALVAAGEPDRIADVAAVRERFEAPWVRWNIARTVAATGTLGCLAWALAQYGRAAL